LGISHLIGTVVNRARAPGERKFGYRVYLVGMLTGCGHARSVGIGATGLPRSKRSRYPGIVWAVPDFAEVGDQICTREYSVGLAGERSA
jgi:hypothetical protein